MAAPAPEPRPAFTPTVWVLLHPGTNGQVASWGAPLSGSPPPRIDA